jgi:hypothetical protein
LTALNDFHGHLPDLTAPAAPSRLHVQLSDHGIDPTGDHHESGFGPSLRASGLPRAVPGQF